MVESVVFLGVLFLIAIIMLPLLFLRGFIICQMWGWFITPYFVGAPDLTMSMALGLSCFISLFTMNSTGSKADMVADAELDMAKKFQVGFGPIVATLILWGMAAIIKGYLPAATVIEAM